MKKYFKRKEEREGKAPVFIIWTESTLTPGRENHIAESYTEAGAIKIIDALNLRDPQEDRIRELEIFIRDAISEFETVSRPSTALRLDLYRSVRKWREKAIALLDKETQ